MPRCLSTELTRHRAESAFLLRLKGLEYKEIGQRLGLSKMGAKKACSRAESKAFACMRQQQATVATQHKRVLTRIACVHLWEWYRNGHDPAQAMVALQALRDIRVIVGLEGGKAPKPAEAKAKLDAMDACIDAEQDRQGVAKLVRRLEWAVLGKRITRDDDLPVTRFMGP